MFTTLPKENDLLQGCVRLKFTTSKPGIDDLTARGWVVLCVYGPMQDDTTYTLLGLPPKDE